MAKKRVAHIDPKKVKKSVRMVRDLVDTKVDWANVPHECMEDMLNVVQGHLNLIQYMQDARDGYAKCSPKSTAAHRIACGEKAALLNHILQAHGYE